MLEHGVCIGWGYGGQGLLNAYEGWGREVAKMHGMGGGGGLKGREAEEVIQKSITVALLAPIIEVSR